LIDSANLFRLVQLFDVLAAVVFAVSGALIASRKGLDVMGFMWFAVITGVGGGTVRDLILNVPVFWVQQPVHVSACLVTAVVMHFVAPLVESRYQTLLWFDAFGLALVTVAGTAKAVDVAAPALVAIAMGAVTGQRALLRFRVVRLEDGFDRRAEDLSHSKGERQARIVSAGLDRVHGLTRHLQPLRQIRLRPVVLRAQHLEPVLHR